jgi:uncharacterized protein (TIGR00725 family)
MARQVAVCGPNDCTDQEREWAVEVGVRLADAGVVVLCGGGGGVMAAVAAGVHSRGGVVVGIRPDDSSGERASRNSQGAAGPDDLTVTVRTNLGQARNAVLVTSADAVLAIGGSWGTLSEVALAMRLSRPTIWLGGWQIRDAAGDPVPGVTTVDSPGQAVAAALHRPRWTDA